MILSKDNLWSGVSHICFCGTDVNCRHSAEVTQRSPLECKACHEISKLLQVIHPHAIKSGRCSQDIMSHCCRAQAAAVQSWVVYFRRYYLSFRFHLSTKSCRYARGNPSNNSQGISFFTPTFYTLFLESPFRFGLSVYWNRGFFQGLGFTLPSYIYHP